MLARIAVITMAAISALQKIDDVRAVDHLVRVMGRGIARVDTAIVRAIQNLTDHDPGEPDFDWRQWWQESRADYGLKDS